MYFAEASGRANCAIYERSALGVGSIIDGPAIVEEPDFQPASFTPGLVPSLTSTAT